MKLWLSQRRAAASASLLTMATTQAAASCSTGVARAAGRTGQAAAPVARPAGQRIPAFSGLSKTQGFAAQVRNGRGRRMAPASRPSRGPFDQCASPSSPAAGCAVPAQPGRPQGGQPRPAGGRLYGRCVLGACAPHAQLTNNVWSDVVASDGRPRGGHWCSLPPPPPVPPRPGPALIQPHPAACHQASARCPWRCTATSVSWRTSTPARPPPASASCSTPVGAAAHTELPGAQLHPAVQVGRDCCSHPAARANDCSCW